MNSSLGEAVTRAAAEELFPGLIFVKTRRIEWLQGYELDCYNADVMIGLEYQGIQHRQYTPHFHRNGIFDLFRQQARDDWKAAQCAYNGVWLITVPDTVPLRGIRDYVHAAIRDLGWVPELPVPERNLETFLAETLANNDNRERMLESAKAIARKHGGVCLSDRYYNCREPLLFRCVKGHYFEAAYMNVNQPDYRGPRFCPECGGTKRKTEAQLQAAAHACGYELQGVLIRRSESGRPYRYMILSCPVGHPYEAQVSNFFPIEDGIPHRGCIRCARAKSNQERMVQEREGILANLGIEPLEPHADRHANVDWMCRANGHAFTCSYHTLIIRRGNKCLRCR